MTGTITDLILILLEKENVATLGTASLSYLSMA